MKDNPSPRYRAFILRLWQNDELAQAWRYSLEEIGRSLPRRGFRDLAALTAFLRAEFDYPIVGKGGQSASDESE